MSNFKGPKSAFYAKIYIYSHVMNLDLSYYLNFGNGNEAYLLDGRLQFGSAGIQDTYLRSGNRMNWGIDFVSSVSMKFL